MHKRSIILLLLFLAVLLPIAAQLVGDEPAVSVRTGDLRSSPGFLAVITAKVEYGETVRVLEVRGDWLRVQALTTGDEGWLHSTAVAEKTALRLEGDGGRDSGVSSREIALAGRGFNEQVEEQYKSENGLDFDEVDRMEALGQPVDELVAFLEAGELTAGGAQ